MSIKSLQLAVFISTRYGKPGYLSVIQPRPNVIRVYIWMRRTFKIQIINWLKFLFSKKEHLKCKNFMQKKILRSLFYLKRKYFKLKVH